MSGGHALAMLIEHGRLELLLGLIDLFDLILDKIEHDPQAALIGDEQFGEQTRMMTNRLDCAERGEFFVVGRGGRGQILEYVVFVDHSRDHLKRAHVEHVHVARLETNEQVTVVVEQCQRRQASVVHDLWLQLVF